MKSIYQSAHPLSKIGIMAFVALLCFFITFFLGALLAIPFFGIDSFKALTSSSLIFDKENVDFLKYFQVIQSIGLFIVPAIVLAFLFGNGIADYLQISKRPYLQSIGCAILLLIVLSPVINIVGIWNSELKLPQGLASLEKWMRDSEDNAKLVTDLFLDTTSIPGLLMNILMIGIIPAIGEEFLFRGVIQKVFHQWTKNEHYAIWITAILFSALHMQFYGFIPRVILGAMFGYLFVWSGNLWLPVIAHFFNNTLAVVTYYLFKIGIINVNPDDIGTDSSYWPLAITGLLFGGFLIYKLILFERSKQLKRI